MSLAFVLVFMIFRGISTVFLWSSWFLVGFHGFSRFCHSFSFFKIVLSAVYYYNIYLGKRCIRKYNLVLSGNVVLAVLNSHSQKKWTGPMKIGACEDLAVNFAEQHYLFEMFLMFCLLDLRSKHMIIHSSNSWSLWTWLILTNNITASSDAWVRAQFFPLMLQNRHNSWGSLICQGKQS